MRDKRTRSHDFVAFGFEEVQVSSTQLGGIHITTDLDNKTARTREEKPALRASYPRAYQKALEDLRKYLLLQ